MRNISRKKKQQESSVSAYSPEGLLVHKGFFFFLLQKSLTGNSAKSSQRSCQILMK